MMSDSMVDMAYFLVLAFMVAHFVALFGWSNLGLITAVHGACDVLARRDGVDGWPGRSAVLKQLWEIAERETPTTRVADYRTSI